MHTVEILEQALALVKRLGYSVRYESLACRSGACELKGKKILFLDLGLSPDEQLEHVLALLRESSLSNLALPHELQGFLGGQS